MQFMKIVSGPAGYVPRRAENVCIRIRQLASVPNEKAWKTRLHLHRNRTAWI